MASTSSSIYPYNIVPQVHSPEPTLNSSTCLKCPTDLSMQFIIFDSNNLCVIKGYEWKSQIELKEFFVPCEQYLEYELILKTAGIYDSITLDYGNLALDNGGIEFLAIFPQYHWTELNNQYDWWINFMLPTDTEWRKMGRIFMWNGTQDSPVPPLTLRNISGEDITLKILMGTTYRIDE